ncbi:MAG: sensor histidine kinase [Actinomycetota bacterium]
MAGSDLRDVSLIAVTSHEMRAPLAAIRGFVDMLQRRREELSEEEIDEFLGVISVQTERLIRLADDLVTMESLDDQELAVAPESIVIVPALEQIARELPGGDRVELRISADAPPSIEADALRLAQVLANLLTNALKYSGEDALVTLAVDAADEDRVRISVIDRGIGIREDERERVFDPFYRTVEGVRSAEGTGLGLTITRRIVRALGGAIDAVPTPGGGTTFRVTLPVRASAS